MKKKIFLILLIILLPCFVMAAEFGLVLNQYVDVGSSESENMFVEYNALLVPRLLFLFDDSSGGNFLGSLFISAGLNARYFADELVYVPELLRTELYLQWGSLGVSAGRFGYSTPLPFLIDGLFDGVRFSYNSGLGNLSFGAWFTSLLYKKNIGIGMTETDRAINDVPLDYGNLTGTYFAPQRFLASFDWENLAVADILRLNAALTAQMDLSRAVDSYNSQYLSLKIGLPAGSIFFELGAILSTGQTGSTNDFDMAFAGNVGIYWTLPTRFNSRIALNALYTSGQTNGLIGAFVPVTTSYAGDIFLARLTALTVLDLDYLARFNENFGINLNAKYFIRNDLVTDSSYNIAAPDDNGQLLGAEFYAGFSVTPVSDLNLNVGGGMFVPQLGNNWSTAIPLWLVKFALIFTFY